MDERETISIRYTNHPKSLIGDKTNENQNSAIFGKNVFPAPNTYSITRDPLRENKGGKLFFLQTPVRLLNPLICNCVASRWLELDGQRAIGFGRVMKLLGGHLEEQLLFANGRSGAGS